MPVGWFSHVLQDLPSYPSIGHLFTRSGTLQLKVRPGSETSSFATPDTSSPSEVVLLALVEWYSPPAHPEWYSPGKQRPQSGTLQGRNENGKVRTHLNGRPGATTLQPERTRPQPDRQGADSLKPTARCGHTETGATSSALLHHLQATIHHGNQLRTSTIQHFVTPSNR